MMNAAVATLLFSPIFPKTLPATRPVSLPKPCIIRSVNITRPVALRRDFRAWADDGDADGGGPDDYDMEDDEAEDKMDFDVDYDTGVALLAAGSGHGGDDDITMVHSKSFVPIQGWDSEKIVDYRINEELLTMLRCFFSFIIETTATFFFTTKGAFAGI